MTRSVIKVENLSKQYRLGSIGTGTLSSDLNRWWARLRGNEDPFALVGETNDRTTKGKGDYVWALKDLNFDVKEGEVMGIVGRNGAGKSTLLKVLSKVTSPTTGQIKVRGRIASLLEVGTGFHPELTGRENIFLNGAILGMSKQEIRSKFDEIVDFAGIERYIDTPVKRYSSGMYVRLAFAVAAFLEPEILIVDEVLAVGDAEFQRKCLGRMSDVSVNDGRTILFVSHNMMAMQKLCKTGMLMQNGQLISTGPMKAIIEEYLVHGFSNFNERSFEVDNGKLACIQKVKLVDAEGESIHEVPIGKPWMVQVYYQINKPVDNFISAIGILNSLEVPINTSWQEPKPLKPGIYCAEFKENAVIYAIGKYRIDVGISIGLESMQYIENAIDLNIVPVIEDAQETVMNHDSTSGVILNQLSMRTFRV